MLIRALPPPFSVDALHNRPLRYFRYCRGRTKRPGVRFSMPEGYCVKCKAKKEIVDAMEVTTKNGRKAIKGKCPTCGTVMYKILGGKASAPAGGPDVKSAAKPEKKAEPQPSTPEPANPPAKS